MEKPKYTLLFDIKSLDGYISRCREFYKTMTMAAAAKNIRKDQSPTIRPYSSQADRKYLVDYQKP